MKPYLSRNDNETDEMLRINADRDFRLWQSSIYFFELRLIALIDYFNNCGTLCLIFSNFLGGLTSNKDVRA